MTTPAHAQLPAPSPRRSFSLATRLTLYYAISSFALVFIVGATLYYALLANLFREDDEHLVSTLAKVEEILAYNDPENWKGLRQHVDHAQPAPHHDMSVLLRIIDARGVTVMETQSMGDILPITSFPEAHRVSLNDLEARNIYDHNGRRRRVMAVKYDSRLQYRPSNSTASHLPSSTTPTTAISAATPGEWTVQIALIEEKEDEFLERFRRVLIIALSISVVVCAAIGYTIARRGLRPLALVAETVRGIQPTSLKQRLELANVPREIAELATSFNAMMDRLEDSFDRLSRFSADIAHELRTPIHNLRGTTEVALGNARSSSEYRDVLISNLEESARLSQLIDNLLFIARAEDPRTAIQRVEIDAVDELATVRDFYAALAEEAQVTLNLAAQGPMPASVDRTLFQRAVGNLVENAIAYTPRGGSVTLHASTTPETLTVSVRDTGTGIAPEHLPHLFDRFYRADPSRTRTTGGFGLGLSLVRSITTLHGGTTTLQSTPGAGTTATLTFPTNTTPT